MYTQKISAIVMLILFISPVYHAFPYKSQTPSRVEDLALVMYLLNNYQQQRSKLPSFRVSYNNRGNYNSMDLLSRILMSNSTVGNSTTEDERNNDLVELLLLMLT